MEIHRWNERDRFLQCKALNGDVRRVEGDEDGEEHPCDVLSIQVQVPGIREGEYCLTMRYSNEKEGVVGLKLSSKSFAIRREPPRGLAGEACARHPDVREACRGCRVASVEAGVALSVCEGGGEDALLDDNERRARSVSEEAIVADGVSSALADNHSNHSALVAAHHVRAHMRRVLCSM